MDNKELISVIVPIYNSRPYLEKCFRSIVNQSYQQMEIILVDDGSTDGSGELCDELCRRDERVRVIHKKNGGTGSAKNAGLAAAHGEYIALVDSDDWIDTRAVEKLVSKVEETGADVVYYYVAKGLKTIKTVKLSYFAGCYYCVCHIICVPLQPLK